MTDRRTFLTRSGLALGALIVGDEVLEALDRLTHRKVFAVGGLPQDTWTNLADLPACGYSVTEYQRVQWNFNIAYRNGLVVTPYSSPHDYIIKANG